MYDDSRISTITLCGSIRCFDEMVVCATELESSGFTVHLPDINERVDDSRAESSDLAGLKSGLIRQHMEKIRQSDAILVVNAERHGQPSYIGANAFLEMGFAFAFGKQIYLLNEIPDQPNRDEIAGLLPICLHGDVSHVAEMSRQ